MMPVPPDEFDSDESSLPEVSRVARREVAPWGDNNSMSGKYWAGRENVGGKKYAPARKGTWISDEPGVAFEQIAKHHGGAARGRRFLRDTLAAGDSW